MSNKKVSIIIVNWNQKAFLLECLNSLKSNDTYSDMEIIVVDNASTDGSVDAIRGLELKIIQNTENLGFSKANNIGMEMSTGKYICLMNSDIKILPNCISIICDYMDNNPNIGMVGPQIFYPDMKLQMSCRHFPNILNQLLNSLGVTKYLPDGKYCKEATIVRDTKEVDCVSGCLQVARRDAIAQVGLLDEQFFFYSEDVDWCKRFSNAGWRIVHLTEARAIHYGGASSSEYPSKFFVEHFRSKLKYYNKHFNQFSKIILNLILIFHFAIRISFYSIYMILCFSNKHINKIRDNCSCLKLLFNSND